MNRSSVCNNLYNHKLHNPLAVSRRYFGLYHNGFYIFDGFFILIFMHHASYVRIGQTGRSSPQESFYIFSQQIYLIFFLDLSHHLRLFLSTKCRVSPNVALLGS